MIVKTFSAHLVENVDKIYAPFSKRDWSRVAAQSTL
jgi:hypothetical protein